MMIKTSSRPPAQGGAAPSKVPIGVAAHPTMTDPTTTSQLAALRGRSCPTLRAAQSGTLMSMTRIPADLGSMLPGLLGLDHVGVAVADIEAAISFYRDVLGLQVVHREDNLDQQVVEVMLASSEGGPAGGQLQLLMPLAENSVVQRFLIRRGSGLHHVAYAVSDVRSASRTMRQRGVRVLYDAPRAGTRGSQINFVHPNDTGGVLLELVEPAAVDPHSG